MKLEISSSKNSKTYYVFESYRKDNKVCSRLIEKIGEHNKMLKDGIADPLKYAKERVAELNKAMKEQKVSINQTIDFKTPLASDSVVSRSTAMNIGWFYVHKIYDQLHVSDYLNSIDSKRRYDLNNIIEYFVINRFLFPGSKREAFLSKDKILFSPDYSLHDGYRSLTVLNTDNDLLQRTLFENSKKLVNLETDILYYDCTNFYFECEEQDDNEYSEDGDIIQWGLRRYGASKEHRPNPIVQMGLFTDKNGIPLSYCVEHGSNCEQNTVAPMERRMMTDYKTSKYIYCSDGGLGSYDNRFFNTLSQRDYVVTQSLKKTGKEELDCVFTDLNWKYISTNKQVSLNRFKEILDKKYEGKELTPEESQYISEDMIYKMYPATREINGKFLKDFGIRIKGSLKMEETVFVTFSAKYYLYQRNLFDRQLETAKLWCRSRDPETIKKGPNDIRRFIKTIASTKDGEVADNKTHTIDEDVVANEKKFHGFYAVATSLDKNIKEILSINASRWKIEQSFRLLKTDFNSRPVYASTEEHIRAHFAICYMALLIYRILERKLYLLDTDKNSFSSNQILTTIRNMNVISQQNSYYQSVYTGSVILTELEKLFKLELDKAYYNPKKLEKIISS